MKDPVRNELGIWSKDIKITPITRHNLKLCCRNPERYSTETCNEDAEGTRRTGETLERPRDATFELWVYIYRKPDGTIYGLQIYSIVGLEVLSLVGEIVVYDWNKRYLFNILVLTVNTLLLPFFFLLNCRLFLTLYIGW